MVSCLSLLSAIAWQGLYSHRNAAFRQRLAEHAAEVMKQLDDVKAKRVSLETRVIMLRPGSIDADLVDEIARRDLNMGNKHEIVAHFSN